MTALLAPAPPSPDHERAALTAFTRIASAWGLTQPEAAALADLSPSTWKRVRAGAFAGQLTRDQLLRLSALIGIWKALELYFSPENARRWPTAPNAGPLFEGRRPVDAMITGGLPSLIETRRMLDALRGGL